MKPLLWALILGVGLATPTLADAANVIIAGEDGTVVVRGDDQIRTTAGTELRAGDVVRCLGRSNLKAFIGDTLVLFGPVSQTRIVSTSPLELELERGALRFVTSADRNQGTVTVQTEASRITSSDGNILIRYNAASQFTELITLDGSASGENRIGSTGSITLEPHHSSLLSPESPPTPAARVAAGDLTRYERVTTLNVAPVPGDDVYATLDPVLDRLDQEYADVRSGLGRPSVPLHAPYRTLDTQRLSHSSRILERSSISAAPGKASINLNWTITEPSTERRE